MLNSATNCSLQSSQDEAVLVEEDYCTNHIIEEVLRGLNYAVSLMLTAMNHISKFKSKASDADADERKGNFLVSRTANSF